MHEVDKCGLLLHPGELLKEEVITPRGLTITQAATLLGINRVTLSNVLNGQAAVSIEMAFRIAKVFGGRPEFWVRLQNKYDFMAAQQNAIKKTKNLKPFIPVSEQNYAYAI